MIRRILAVAAAAALAALVLAAPAHADIPCNTNQVCVYENANYAGAVSIWSNPAPGTCINITSTLKNNVSSIHNETAHSVTFHTGTCGDTSHNTLSSHSSWSDLSGILFWPWNDNIESFTTNSTAAPAQASTHSPLIVPDSTGGGGGGGGCGAGLVCLFTNANYGGTADVQNPVAIGACMVVTAGVRFQVSSIINNTKYRIYYNSDAHCGSLLHYTTNDHVSIPQLGTDWNDAIGSLWANRDCSVSTCV